MIHRGQVRALVARAADVIPLAWPLDRFVAVNPLGGFETAIFDDATMRAGELFRARVLPASECSPSKPRSARTRPHPNDFIAAIGHSKTLGDACKELGWDDVVARVDERTSRWLSAFCDRGEASWPMPHRDFGFFTAWKRLARYENGLATSARAYRIAVDALPARPEDALLENLRALSMPDACWLGYLQRHLAQCAGWAAFVKRRIADREPGLDLVSLLAVRTWYERLAFSQAAGARGLPGTYEALCSWIREDPARVPLSAVGNVDCVAHAAMIARLEARERAYRDDVLDRIDRAPARSSLCPQAQFVFCIDARSEPIRRHLEELGPYETFGFAGFFGLPLLYRPYGTNETIAQAPVLVRPTLTVDERPDRAGARREEQRLQLRNVREALKDGMLSPIGAFAGVEALGLFGAIRAALRTLVRYEPRKDAVLPLDVEQIGEAERAFFTETLLRIIGLTRDFAPLVVLCGHRGGTVNNAFAAALDCGACGGNPGVVNARVACALLNDGAVRAALRARGIEIPAQTRFIAAEHDTTRDTVRFVTEDIPDIDLDAIARLDRAVRAAAQQSCAERMKELPPSPLGFADAVGRARDWAQPRPEWGLARNAGFIIGPRALTRGIDLAGRCFLHSYDAESDVGGAVLEQILTAPLVVAQWINAQYFFATVDPGRFGSGDKTVQQPVGGFGVVLGNGGDLRPGLPLQSTWVGDTPYHEPLRLQVFVVAPRSRIDAVIARQTVLQRLFDNRWVTLVALDPNDHSKHRYVGKHRWLPIPSKEVVPCSPIA